MPPAARLTDMHTCPMVTPGLPPIPHVGGPVIGPCAMNVLIGGLPAARVSDMGGCRFRDHGRRTSSSKSSGYPDRADFSYDGINVYGL